MKRRDAVSPVGPDDPSTSDGVDAFRFEAHGLSIALDLESSVVDAVRDHLPPGSFARRDSDASIDRRYAIDLHPAKGPEETARPYRLTTEGSAYPGRFVSPNEVAEQLESELQMYVAEFARPHLFLHAGVVQWHGKVIVLPGSSFAGKSTLVRALVQMGATYFSDEFAVLDAGGCVSPYPRRLAQRDGPLGPRARIDLLAHAPAINGEFEPLPVDVVALMRYDATAEWRCEPLLGGTAVIAISEHMVPIRARPAETLQMLVSLVAGASVYRCVRPNLEVAIDWLRDHVCGENSSSEQR